MSHFIFNTNPPSCEIDQTLKQLLRLKQPDINLFNDTAKLIAEEMANPQLLKFDRRNRVWQVRVDKNVNKITQLRKFYDEICMWESKNRNLQAFAENLPFVKMLNAKVAYARSREYVDDKFVILISECLSQINEVDETGVTQFKNFRTFFEAFYGFYRAERVAD